MVIRICRGVSIWFCCFDWLVGNNFILILILDYDDFCYMELCRYFVWFGCCGYLYENVVNDGFVYLFVIF